MGDEKFVFYCIFILATLLVYLKYAVQNEFLFKSLASSKNRDKNTQLCHGADE